MVCISTRHFTLDSRRVRMLSREGLGLTNPSFYNSRGTILSARKLDRLCAAISKRRDRSLRSASEPDVRVSPHPAPQLSGDCHSHRKRMTYHEVIASRGSVDPLPESEQVLFQEIPGQPVPAIIHWHGLNSVGRLYLPDNRAHVSVSPGFPRGVGFLGNPTAVRLAAGTCSRGAGGHARGYFVPQPRRVPDVGPDYPPGESV